MCFPFSAPGCNADPMLHLIVISSQFSLICQFISLLIFSMPLTFWSVCQLLCVGFAWCFFVIRVRLSAFSIEYHRRMLNPSQFIISGGTWYRCVSLHVTLTFITWAKAVSARLLHHNYLFLLIKHFVEIPQDHANILFLIILSPTNFNTDWWYLSTTIITAVLA